MRILFSSLLVILLAGCLTMPEGPGDKLGEVTIATDPPGGTVTLEPGGQRVQAGTPVKLKPGSYRARAEEAGYPPTRVAFELQAGARERVLIRFGQGNGVLALRGQPAGAEVSLDGAPVGALPLTTQVKAGDHKVAVSAAGFLSQEKTVTVAAGQPTRLTFRLEKAPTPVVDVRFATRPAGGQILFGDEPLDAAAPRIDGLKPGTYKVHGVKDLDALTRLTGERTFSVPVGGSKKPLEVVVPLTQRQLRYDNTWMDAAAALRREARRYGAQRVARPVEVKVRLTAAEHQALAQDPHLAEALDAILRVGDRVRFEQGGQTWTLWKRDRAITPAFRLAVDAFCAGTAAPDWWHAAPAQVVRAQPDLGAIALALARGLGDPLLDLGRTQLSDRGETVYRDAADGRLTLVVLGTQGLSVSGAETESFGPLTLARVAPGSGPLRLAWTHRPERLVVAAPAHLAAVTPPPAGAALKADEKRIVRLADAGQVQQLVRFTRGPDHPGWQRETTRHGGPLAGQMDLSRDELGPNGVAGEYRRAWVLVLKTAAGTTQRQVQTSYRVLSAIKDPTGDRFLRRSKLDAVKVGAQ
jgi:hypothetical protein